MHKWDYNDTIVICTIILVQQKKTELKRAKISAKKIRSESSSREEASLSLGLA